MGQHSEQNRLIAAFGEHSRIETRVYCGGNNPPEIQIIERYAPRADGVQEHGGRLITTVPYKNNDQAESYAARFSEAVQSAGLAIPYAETNDTRRRIENIAKGISL